MESNHNIEKDLSENPLTHENIVRAYLALYETLSSVDKEVAKKEIIRCAMLADRYMSMLKLTTK